jgi:hypothetical protein
MKINVASMSDALLADGPDLAQVRGRPRVAYAGAMLSLLSLAAAPGYAANDIHSFVACVNALANPTVADAVACVPADCYTTVTMSEESAQPACRLRDGTSLPRVIFSCPGTNGSQTLRFRPSFTLCTQSGIINHIEVGEDVNKRTRTDDPDLRNFPYVQKMADFDMTLNVDFTEFGTGATAVLDAASPANSKACAECHDRKGTLTMAPSNIANLFLPIPPALADGTIFTNDPAVVGPAGQTDLGAICTGIANSTQLANSRISGLQNLAYSLCTALDAKTY